MSPTPQEHATREEIPATLEREGDRIVISGMSGLYPDSHSVKDLSELLYNKINPISEAALRFKNNHPEVVKYAGTVPEADLFDAQFFKVHYRLSSSMDPMARKLLEQAYQAIYDAGVNPEELSGKKVGVYIGTCFSETEKASFYQSASKSGLGIAGCSKTMFANRISYWLNAKGPSMAIDVSCCSSTAALEQAYLAMSRGECEAAIVGGAYLGLHPQSAVHYGRIIKLSQDGKTKSFDKNADGCVKSEAINVLFLQKAKNALRVYADLLHAKSEFTCILPGVSGPQYGYYRDIDKTVSFIKKVYEEARVSPQAIEYVEAYGCAVPDADKVELQAFEEVFCNNREDSLLVGSVMSNIGYNEAASGITAITKVLLGYHTGQLAANWHCSNPRQDILALREGRMRIATEQQSFRRSYVAVNGMSVTGVNTHVLLHGHYKPKDPNRYKSSIAHLVTISARHEAAVTHCLEELKINPIDPEQLRLLHNIHQANISGHLGRGFIILQTNEEQKTVCLSEKVEYFDNARPPLWFVYSGMGSQWAGMGAQLMRIPIFAAAIERCHKVLEPKGINIVDIITSPDETFDNILHSFVGITAVQIGLTDILRELGLVPDKIIGHSVGELGCAYADGCLTAEELILAAYSRGRVSLETKFIRGSMAAIGLGYQQILPMCPPEIQVACHNGPESSTISGPTDVMKEFVAKLTTKGIFAKEVPCSNIAYHSRYIADAGPQLLKYLSEVIKDPKPRTERWLSTSVPEEKWNDPIAKLCSAEYHTNNLLNPVLFEETSRLIPNNAVLVEVAPHGLLQAILKRSLPSNCKNIALTRRNHADNTILLLEGIGKLFMEGYNPKVHVLYPKVELPVSSGTPFLSHLVKWAHGEKWPLLLYSTANRIIAASFDYVTSVQDKENSYLQGHSMREVCNDDLVAAFVNLKGWCGARVIVCSAYLPGERDNPTEDLVRVVEYAARHNAELLIGCDANAHHSSWGSTDTNRRGHNLYPFAATLALVWDTFSMTMGKLKKQMSVEFRDLHLYAQPIIHDQRQLRFHVALHRGNGNFEILNEGSKVASGYIKTFYDVEDTKLQTKMENKEETANLALTAEDIYHLLRDRDYSYSGEFRSIEGANESLSEASLVWRDNWVTFIDGMLQLNMLRQPHDGVSLVTYIRNIKINVKYHQNVVEKSFVSDYQVLLKARVLENSDITSCGGITISNVGFENMPHRSDNKMTLKALKLVPYSQSDIDWGGEFYVPLEDSVSVSNNVSLQSSQLGDLDSLTWVETPEKSGYGVPVKVQYAGINYDDVKKASGSLFHKQNIKNSFGMEFSGITESGERVMGLVRDGATRSVVRAQPELLWPVPAHWSLEDAATVPLAYVHALYCLGIKSQFVLTHSQDITVLVHGGAGAFGQAVISIALAYGFEVFTTVSDVCKKRFLRKLFPGLKAEHIGNSRDHSFGDKVLTATKGEGCDLVIGCVGKHLKKTSFNCVKDFGLFIDVSQLHNQDDFTLGMNYLIKERGYVATDVSSIFNPENIKDAVALQAVLSEGIRRGYVRPLSRVTYASHDAARAFRLLSASQHRGRVLLRIQSSTLEAQPRLTCKADRCHLILCNNETFGLQLADRLVERGARKLCVHINKLSLSYLQIKIRSWQRLGVEVVVCSDDLSEETAVNALLNNAMRIGSIEGVYVIVGDKQQNIDVTLLNTLDLVSRKFCTDIQNFAILNTGDNTIGKEVCLRRVRSNLPATILSLPELSLDSCNIAAWYHGALEVTEKALRATQSVFVAHTMPVQQTTLLQQIIALADVTIKADSDKNTTLYELGVTSDKILLIYNFLRIHYNVVFGEKEIPLITIDMIQQLEKSLSKSDFKDSKGLSTFFTYVDSDELLATTDFVVLPTLVNNADMRADEFDSTQTYLCIVPGMEGHHERFRVLCERLKLPALVLQPGLDQPNETVQETAERLAEVWNRSAMFVDEYDKAFAWITTSFDFQFAVYLKKTGVKNHFYLLGYESGLFVALEIAAFLENHGLTGTVFCVGYAPDEFNVHLEEQLAEFKTKEQLQDAVARHMFTLMAGGDTTGLDNALQTTSTWSQKVDACVRTLLGRVPHSAQYARALFETSLRRIERARGYVPRVHALCSQLILMRAASAHPAPSPLALQQHSQRPVIVHQLRAPLAHAPTDLQSSPIVNTYLDSTILEAFDKKNICNTYLMNADTFMVLVDTTSE